MAERYVVSSKKEKVRRQRWLKQSEGGEVAGDEPLCDTITEGLVDFDRGLVPYSE